VLPGAQVRAPQPGYVNVAVGQVGRGGQRREQFLVLPGRRRLDVGGGVAVEPGPQPRRQLPGLVEPLRGAQVDEPPGRPGAEQVRKYPLPVVGVVYEQQQVTEADQGVGTVRRLAERIGPAVHIADHMHPHANTLGKSCQAQEWVAGPGAVYVP
jgi:hypothetical protein